MTISEVYGEDIAQDLKLLVVYARCVNSVERRLFPLVRAGGFTLAQFNIMEILFHRGAMTVNELIAKSFSTGGNLDVIIRNLINAGLIQKNMDPADKRIRIIDLTAEGKSRMQEFLPGHFMDVHEALSGISQQEKAVLIELLKKLGKSL